MGYTPLPPGAVKPLPPPPPPPRGGSGVSRKETTMGMVPPKPPIPRPLPITNCPSCGAPGRGVCKYCGRGVVKTKKKAVQQAKPKKRSGFMPWPFFPIPNVYPFN